MVPNIFTAIIAVFSTAVTAEYGAMPDLSPRYDLGQAARLVNRQTGVCPKANEHTCLDIGFGSFCCENNNYCIVANSTAACCFIGSTCGNLCDASHYECPVTVTVSSTVTVTTSCCDRRCTSTSAYLCPSALGGQCCNYDSGCAANSQCAASTTSSNIASATGSSAGSSPTTGNVPSSSSGLSTGAKAGIGAGVAGGALVIIAGLLWFCTVHRRRVKVVAASVPAMSQRSETGTKRPSHGKSGSDYFGPTAAHGPFTEPHDSAATSPGAYRGVPVSPQGPGDITVPVEIDARDSRGHSNATTPGAFEYVKGPGTTIEPVEMP